jgi:hypothetical protein
MKYIDHIYPPYKVLITHFVKSHQVGHLRFRYFTVCILHIKEKNLLWLLRNT